MSYESNITATDFLFAGEDKTLSYEVFAAGSTTVMEDVSMFSLRWEMRKEVSNKAPVRAQGTSVLFKTTSVVLPDPGGIVIVGVYNAVRASNTQRVLVSLLDTDTEGLAGGTYVCALKRMDVGLEAVLSHGTVELLVAAAR